MLFHLIWHNIVINWSVILKVYFWNKKSLRSLSISSQHALGFQTKMLQTMKAKISDAGDIMTESSHISSALPSLQRDVKRWSTMLALVSKNASSLLSCNPFLPPAAPKRLQHTSSMQDNVINCTTRHFDGYYTVRMKVFRKGGNLRTGCASA